MPGQASAPLLARLYCSAFSGAALLSKALLQAFSSVAAQCLSGKNFFAYTGIYEIVPGFIISALAIYVVSLLDKKPDASIVKDFDVAEAHIQDM